MASTLRGLALGAVLASLAACGGGRALSVLDERTGLTLVRASEPLAFARGEPRYSRSERDYVYLGPVETNRQGVREYYLWVGIGTTLDRGFLAPEAGMPTTLYVELRGEPVELPLHPWGTLVATTARRAAYGAPVPLRVELGARVTLQQLRLFDAEPLGSVRLAIGDGAALRTYTRWSKATGFADFLTAVGAPSGP